MVFVVPTDPINNITQPKNMFCLGCTNQKAQTIAGAPEGIGCSSKQCTSVGKRLAFVCNSRR